MPARHGVLFGWQLMASYRNTGSALLKAIRARREAIEAAREAELKQLIEAGPPRGSSIPLEAWRDWHEYGFVVCPRTKTTCVERVCGMGASCLAMKAIGMRGDGTPLKRKDRPRCGARNRQGRPCAVRVEPGKSPLPFPWRPFHGSTHRGRQGPHRSSPAATVGAASPKIGVGDADGGSRRGDAASVVCFLDQQPDLPNS